MSTFLFPDNTVLCNFAAVERLDLLRAVLNGRGRWTSAVAYEAEKSTRFLSTLADIPTDGWLDEPTEITVEADLTKVNQGPSYGFRRDRRPTTQAPRGSRDLLRDQGVDSLRRVMVDLRRP